MLEYVYLLTEGRRLAAVIEEQIRQREGESRHDELAIIRATAVLCARGGEVAVDRLWEHLGLGPDRTARALRRLLDEHLVRESRPGVLGGLHALRSKALLHASHDEVAFLEAESFWKVLTAATRETLPRIVQSVLSETKAGGEKAILQKLGETLAGSHDPDVWTGILTGLGLSTLEQSVALFLAILEKNNVQRSQWSLASMFSDP
jgi:hypothetical protein